MCFSSKDRDPAPEPPRPVIMNNIYENKPPAYAAANTTAKPMDQDTYAPPPGPPPGAASSSGPATASATGPHAWETAVPDTSLFPPPPGIFSTWDRSPANNAAEEESDAGRAWCEENPLLPPQRSDDGELALLSTPYDISLIRPPGFCGELQNLQPGRWAVKTTRRAADTSIIGYPQLYAPSLQSPLVRGKAPGGPTYTAYYEVYVRPDSRKEISLALGMAALPYPGFRLPGWHRGSLAVHGDDGHRFIDDDLGGTSFTAPFQRGDTYGLGMRFSPANPAAAASGRSISVEVFFTRNGVLDGSWDLHEEVDADRNRSLEGLEGFHDLYVAIGTFDVVSFEVRLDPSQWAYKGIRN